MNTTKRATLEKILLGEPVRTDEIKEALKQHFCFFKNMGTYVLIGWYGQKKPLTLEEYEAQKECCHTFIEIGDLTKEGKL